MGRHRTCARRGLLPGRARRRAGTRRGLVRVDGFCVGRAPDARGRPISAGANPPAANPSSPAATRAIDSASGTRAWRTRKWPTIGLEMSSDWPKLFGSEDSVGALGSATLARVTTHLVPVISPLARARSRTSTRSSSTASMRILASSPREPRSNASRSGWSRIFFRQMLVTSNQSRRGATSRAPSSLAATASPSGSPKSRAPSAEASTTLTRTPGHPLSRSRRTISALSGGVLRPASRTCSSTSSARSGRSASTTRSRTAISSPCRERWWARALAQSLGKRVRHRLDREVDRHHGPPDGADLEPK